MNKHRRKLLDLMAQRSLALKAAEEGLEKEDKAAYDKAMEELDGLDAQIADVKALIEAYEAAPLEVPPAGGDNGGAGTPQNEDTHRRGSNEYVRAFCNAIRHRVSPVRAGSDYGILLDALTEGVNENGGYLVPVDLQTRINELRRQMVSLRELVTVEPVTTRTGYRVLDTAPTKGFTLLEEMGKIPTDDQPAFSRLTYTCKDYGLIVPISNDLLRDNDAGLLEYLARWMAKKSVLTENTLILTILKGLTATAVSAGKEVAAIKKALNVTLDPDIALNAALLTNQTGYDILDNLVDGNNRPLLQPDLAAGTGYQFKQRPIRTAADRLMPNETAGSPLYIGDFKAFITLFDRQVMEFTTTDVGGDAWRTNSTEGRAIMRLDVQKMDGEAAVALLLSGSTPSTPAGSDTEAGT